MSVDTAQGLKIASHIRDNFGCLLIESSQFRPARDAVNQQSLILTQEPLTRCGPMMAYAQLTTRSSDHGCILLRPLVVPREQFEAISGSNMLGQLHIAVVSDPVVVRPQQVNWAIEAPEECDRVVAARHARDPFRGPIEMGGANVSVHQLPA